MPVKKIIIVLWSALLVFSLFFILKPTQTNADQLEDINKQLADLNADLNKSVAATKPVESELKSMQTQITSIKNQVIAIEADIVQKKKSIDNGYKNLADKEKIISLTIRDFYVKSYNDSPLLTLLSLDNANDVTQALAYQHAKTKQDKAVITNIALSINDLEKRKADLIEEQKLLVVAKASLDDKAVKLDKIVAGAKDFQKNLSGKIAALSAQQQQIIAQKLGSLNIPRSAGTSARGCSSDLTNGKDPGFSPRIGFFTYGAPHRNGLNQYGAWGRAKAGQNEERILSEYFPGKTLKKDYDQGLQIRTTTGWSGSIEDYIKRIYEVPDSWADNNLAVLKAQAVAARSYALNVTHNGSSAICTTESCQVFKPEPKGGNWDQAVEATKGWVLMDGDSPAFTQYASTHGGYILNLGKFDGDGGNPTSFAELNSRAFDRESPWFYCDWGSRGEYAGTAWLKPSEVADIFNVIALARLDSGAGNHLYQPDKPNPAGSDTWSPDKVKSELRAKGGSPIDSVSDVSLSVDFGSGKTTSVSGGGASVTASEFKDWFNLRAPANIQIVGPLFNVERQ